jgi:hypothetical protein
MRRTKRALAAAAALAGVASLSGCGGEQQFDTVTELRDAAIDAGLTCPISQWKLVSSDGETGSCNNNRVVQLNDTNSLTVALAQDSVNAGRTPPTGILISDHWVIYAPWPETLMIQDELGGNATNLQVERVR